MRRMIDVRRPWIQRNDFGVFFHDTYLSPSRNHFLVSLCRSSSALLWLVEGSGGESQF